MVSGSIGLFKRYLTGWLISQRNPFTSLNNEIAVSFVYPRAKAAIPQRTADYQTPGGPNYVRLR